MLRKRKIDHIVYAVPELEVAMDKFEELTGIRPAFGGYHTTQGTKNAVVNLGDDCYLEILAIDKDNTQIDGPRWMGVDLIESAQITRWSLKSENLPSDSTVLQQYHTQMGKIQGGQRKMSTGKTLSWEMIMPLPTPVVELIPFMTDWQNSDLHPTSQLPRQCQLLSLELTHPQPQTLVSTLNQLDIESEIVSKGKTGIRIKIKSPKGVIQI